MIKSLSIIFILVGLTNCIGNEDYTKCTNEEKNFWKANAIFPFGVDEEKKQYGRNSSILMLYYCDQLDKDTK